MTMSGTATATAATALTVGGNFSIGATNTFGNGANALNVAGNFDQNGIFTAGSGAVTLNGGAAVQTISGTGSLGFANLTVNNTGGITLARNVTVTSAIVGTVTLTSTCPTNYTLTSSGGASVAHSCPAPVAPIAEYRMDEASWNGTANEVVDSVGSNHGLAASLVATKPNTAVSSPAIAGNPGTCRYGTFTRANKDYVALPAAFPNLAAAAGDFTISAWINVIDNTLPGQRILIDDQNNSSPGGWGFSVGETTAFGAGGLRFYYRQPAVYILDTVPIPSNQWLFVALSVHLAAGANASTATIYAYNTGGALVTSNTGTFTWSAGSDPGPASIGGETNTSGEGANAFGFGGSLDEIRVYQNALNQAALAAIATQTHACAVNAPNHLEIQSSGSGLTCAASTLTIKACADATCATPYTSGVSGTLSATGAPTANWDGTTGGAAGAGFVIPSGSSSVTKNVQVATAGTVTFGTATATPAPGNVTTCNFGNNPPSNNNCVFTADTAGFIFSNSSTGNTAYTINAHTSGTTQNTDNLLWLRAVQASTANAAVCTPAIINMPVSVNMGYSCNNPATCQLGDLGIINGTPISSAGTPVSLSFDANGSAKITSVRYDDVGEIALTANTTLTPFGGATAVTLTGSSNPFVVKPDHFVLSAIKRTSDNLANPAAANAAGSAFVKAGEAFSVTVTAKNALGGTTANFGQETIPKESVMLTSALVTGLGLTNNAVLGGSFGTFTSGVATGTNFIWNEVGIITLTPSIADGDYLGAGDVTGTTSANVGRFYPDHFVLISGVIVNRSDLTCAPASTFTYMGEPMSLSLTIDAQNASNVKTQNYAGSFAKLDGATASKWITLGGNDSLGLGAVDGTNALSARLAISGMPSGSWAAGTGTLTAQVVFNRGASVDGAFDNLNLGIAPQDADGVKLLSGALNLDADLNAISERIQAATSKVRYGRIKFANAYGSQLLTLNLPLTLQYFNSGGWVTNALDSCSTLAANNFAYAFTGNLNACETAGTLTGSAPNLSLRLAAPGNGNEGNADLALNLGTASAGNTCVAVGSAGPAESAGNQAWLSLPGGTNPTARATFGVYKGRNEFIYLRESY